MKDIRNYSAVAAVVAAFIFVPIVLGNITQAKAIDLIEDSIAKTDQVKTMVITYSMRNPFTYNPDVIDLREKMKEMTGKIIYDEPRIWKFETKNKWYISDGEKSYWYSDAYHNCIVRLSVDTSDLGRFNALFLEPELLLGKVKKMAEDKNAKLEMQTKNDSIILTFNHKVRSIDKYRFMTGDLFGWYNNNIKGSFTTDCRQVYVFNAKTKLLQSFNISVFYDNKLNTILKSNRIEYNSYMTKEEITAIPESIKKEGLNDELNNSTTKKTVIFYSK